MLILGDGYENFGNLVQVKKFETSHKNGHLAKYVHVHKITRDILIKSI